jgi:23S rRNA pseudouridine1911/1915/1917 synthase
VGDPVYGGNKKSPAFGRQALHAQTLALTHPATRRRRSWSAPLPDDMQQLIAELENAG